MRPSAWAGGVAAVAAVLGAAGLALDAPAAAAGAAGLAALLAARAALFLWRTATVADGVVIDRRVERPHVPQGEPVGVVTRVTMPRVDGLRTTLRDLPPASAVYDPREVVVIMGTIRYWVRMTVPGKVAFRGVQLETGDAFFSTVLPMTTPAYAGTTVTVLAAGAERARREFGTLEGDIERDRRSVLRGQAVRSFRPFRPGDDPALVDWKLSAKFRQRYVREPSGQTGGQPLVVVDLPGADDHGAGAVLSAAGSAVDAAVREFGVGSLLVVAGGEVIGFRDGDPDLASLVRMLAARQEGMAKPLFRAADRTALRQREREAARSAVPALRRFACALRANLATGLRVPFEEEVDRALADTEPRDVVLFSAVSGDVSHLALVGAVVRRQGRRLRYHLSRADPAAVARLTPYGPVEAL